MGGGIIHGIAATFPPGKTKTIRPCSRCNDPEGKAPKWQADHIGVPEFAAVEAGIQRAVADFIERGTGNALM